MISQQKAHKLNLIIQEKLGREFTLSSNDFKVKYYINKDGNRTIDVLDLNYNTYFKDLPESLKDDTRKIVEIIAYQALVDNYSILNEFIEIIGSHKKANAQNRKVAKSVKRKLEKFSEKYSKDQIFKSDFFIYETACVEYKSNMSCPKYGIVMINDEPSFALRKSCIQKLDGHDELKRYLNENESEFNKELGILFSDIFDVNTIFMKKCEEIIGEEYNKIMNNNSFIAHKSA